jgi:N-acetylglucosamine-6-phosphate deacetylase
VGVSAAVVGGDIVLGDVVVAEGRVEAVGVSPPGSGGLAVPGLIDLQVNGFAGVDFATADLDGYRAVAAAVAATGVTCFQPTLISLPATATRAALAELGAAIGSIGATIPGMHLEGPFLAPGRCGAHDPANLTLPDPVLMESFLRAGPIAQVTLAPELVGASELISFLVGRGITVALGHSDADAATAHAAFDLGARSVTHLFNAQRPWSHRDPGIAGAALVRSDVWPSVIADGVHLAPDTVRLAARCAGPRLVAITDAISATDMPEGSYRLGDRTVHVEDGAARLADGTLAGSLLTMDRAVRNLVELGIDLPAAVMAATTAPATLLGRHELGNLRPGSAADVAVLSDRLEVRRTLHRGVEVFAA